MLTFIPTSEMSSDSTINYKIELSQLYTVNEFINTICKERPNEWGTVGIFNGILIKHSIYGDPYCEYKYGKVIGKPLPKDILEKPIKSVTARSEWSHTNYIIKL